VLVADDPNGVEQEGAPLAGEAHDGEGSEEAVRSQLDEDVLLDDVGRDAVVGHQQALHGQELLTH
jgi:hypothetical protein